MNRIVKNDRHTVSEAHGQSETAFASDDGIDALPIVTGIRAIDHGHRSAVHQPGRGGSIGCYVEHRQHPSIVFRHSGGIVADRPREIERLKRRGADTTAPRKYTMINVGRTERIELIIRQRPGCLSFQNQRTFLLRSR